MVITVGNAIIFAAVKQMVEANAKISRMALGAVAAVASMAANPFAMSDAASAWKEIANDLGTLANHLDAALGKGEDWIADDKDAFETSLTNFKGEIEQFRTSASDISSTLDMVANIYTGAYVALAAFAGACLVILLGLLALLFVPFASAAARAMIEVIGAMLTAISAKTALLMGSLATAVSTMVAAIAYGWVNLTSKKGMIPTAGEFEQVRVNYETPSRFLAKEK